MAQWVEKLGIGGMKSVKVVLQNPLDKSDVIDYIIVPNDTPLAQDWIEALKDSLSKGLQVEKNFCFLGFPNNPRNAKYLCDQLNLFIDIINRNVPGYIIEDHFCPEAVMFDKTYLEAVGHVKGQSIKHDIMNRLHNHFEVLQGTVDNISDYYKNGSAYVKYSIRQLNNLCHELESLCLSIRHSQISPEWIRPSQITTFLHAPRIKLKPEHRDGFLTNGYDRVFGGVYMHWCQIGKTYFEVYNDEGAPELTDTVCEAINQLEYYSGEFDIEWARSVTYAESNNPWHRENIDGYNNWLDANNIDRNDPMNSLGYLPLGQVDMMASFGTTNEEEVWDILSNHLNIIRIEVDGVSCDFPSNWTDPDHQLLQMKQLGYLK